MASFIDPILETVDSFVAWISSGLKQTTESYCDLETADSPTVLVNHDGSLLSVIRIIGAQALLGTSEFNRLRDGLTTGLQTRMSRPGHAIQVLFNYDREAAKSAIHEILAPARQTANRLNLELKDLFKEREEFIASYCAEESVFFVMWTRPTILTAEQYKRTMKDKQKMLKDHKLPPFLRSQNIVATIPDLRNAHDAFVRGMLDDLKSLSIMAEL